MLGASKGERNGVYPDAEIAGYEEESRGFFRGKEDNALPLRRIKAEDGIAVTEKSYVCK